MADKRKEYKVEINGIEHTMLRLPEDAERYESAVEVKAERPANKGAAPANKGA